MQKRDDERQESCILAVIADEQRPKLVNPGETAFTGEALFIKGSIEEAFPSTFDGFPVALILADVGNDLVIETDFAGFQRIKGTVGVEECSGNRQSQALHAA